MTKKPTEREQMKTDLNNLLIDLSLVHAFHDRANGPINIESVNKTSNKIIDYFIQYLNSLKSTQVDKNNLSDDEAGHV